MEWEIPDWMLAGPERFMELAMFLLMALGVVGSHLFG